MLTGSLDTPIYLLELVYFTGLVWLEKYISVLYANQMSLVCNRIILIIIGVLFLILLPVYFNNNIFNLDPFTFFCFIPIVQAIPLIIYFHKKTSWQFSFLTKLNIHSLISFSLVVFITNTIQFLAYRIDYWIILHYHNVGEVGIYAQANRFAQLLWVIPNIMAALMIPAITSPGSKFRNTEFSALFRGLVYVSILIALGVGLMSFLLYRYFLPQDYSEGLTALIIMIPGFYFFVITILIAAWFSAKRMLWINFWGSLICLGCIFIADILLIPSFGINGAAVSNTIGYMLATFFFIYKFFKISPYNILGLFYLKKRDLNEFFK
jgi:O-antigen/teichoic acid export membrane protein